MEKGSRGVLAEFWHNFTHNLFKPLLLFFAMGFLVPILKVQLEFPYTVYQALVIYLLLAIGWKGGEELAHLEASALGPVLGFMLTGFVTNVVIGIVAYALLSALTKMRRVDKATVAGYYGSDSAGTFAICQGVLTMSAIKFDAYMPVMLAVMEIPGCLVALYLVSRLRHKGMDALGNMPDETGYNPRASAPIRSHGHEHAHGHGEHIIDEVDKLTLEVVDSGEMPVVDLKTPPGLLSGKLLHEVFLNAGLYLLFGGITIGFISGLQGEKVTADDDRLFIGLFQGILCLFLLEMGMTASRKLKDLRSAGTGFLIYGLLAPNLFAPTGILIAHVYSHLTGTHFEPGTYVLFAVLCGAASYIAVPAVQRLAIPEASPTL
ncbi:sodium-dependent bicarbonate transport family permease, partial [Singulisphaera rosea]